MEKSRMHIFATIRRADDQIALKIQKNVGRRISAIFIRDNVKRKNERSERNKIESSYGIFMMWIDI